MSSGLVTQALRSGSLRRTRCRWRFHFSSWIPQDVGNVQVFEDLRHEQGDFDRVRGRQAESTGPAWGYAREKRRSPRRSLASRRSRSPSDARGCRTRRPAMDRSWQARTNWLRVSAFSQGCVRRHAPIRSRSAFLVVSRDWDRRGSIGIETCACQSTGTTPAQPAGGGRTALRGQLPSPGEGRCGAYPAQPWRNQAVPRPGA